MSDSDEHDDSAERLVVLVAVATRKALHRHLVFRLQGEVVGGRIEWREVLDAIMDVDCFAVLDDLRVQERLAEIVVRSKE